MQAHLTICHASRCCCMLLLLIIDNDEVYAADDVDVNCYCVHFLLRPLNSTISDVGFPDIVCDW